MIESSTPNSSLAALLYKLWKKLSPHRRFQLCLLCLVMVASSIAEVMSLASILPFLAVLANPLNFWNDPSIQHWGPMVGILRPEDLLLPITLLFSFLALAAGSIRLFNLWLNGRLAAAIGSDLSCEAYRRTLYQPYTVHLFRNTSEVISSISNDVSRVISNVLNPLLLMLSSLGIAISLVAALLAINWILALSSGFAVFAVYSIAMVANRGPLKVLGAQQVALNRVVIQTLQESIGAIRDVILDGSQQFYTNSFSKADHSLRRVVSDAGFLSAYPRLVMEPIGMVLISIVGFLLVRYSGVDEALPLLGALALGAQRLLPVVQKVYEGWALSRNAKSSLAKVLNLIDQPLPSFLLKDLPEPISFNKCIELENVSFKYKSDSPSVLQCLNLKISRGERIGIVGTTGSGKSTLADLIMGLLVPTNGRILIDGVDLHSTTAPSRISSWRSLISHVPQNIYLTDGTIADNIALCIDKRSVDWNRVYNAAKQAQISDFIESMPNGYDTFVGERGLRLSGGQRQRIAIARALYKNAEVLVFDEATSALDTSTEQSLMNSIHLLSDDLTIIMIAHRLTTVQTCNRIIKLETGGLTITSPSLF